MLKQTANENISIILYSHTKKLGKYRVNAEYYRLNQLKKYIGNPGTSLLMFRDFVMYYKYRSLLHSVEFEGIEPAAFHFVGVYLREYELCFAVVVFDGYGRVMR